MINSVFVPLELLDAEEDNEPPSLEKRHELIACPCPGMDPPSFGLTNKPQFSHHNPIYSGTDLARNSLQGRCLCLPLRGSVGEVLTFFPWSAFSRLPRC